MDDDLKELVRKISFALCIIILFIMVGTFAFLNKFGGKNNLIEDKIYKEQDFVLLIRNQECDNCKRIKRNLREHDIFYDELYSDKDKRYHTILNKLSLSEKDIVEPSLLYIKEGKVIAILVDIENLDDLEDFIEYNINSD